MQKEICQHGHDITNKLGIACPEGCVSNNQRGIENRQLAAELSEFRQELSKFFDVAQRLDAMEPDHPGAFVGTPYERLSRHFAKLLGENSEAG